MEANVTSAMSDKSQTCEVCGARLPANAPGEPCPACLVRSAMGQPQGDPAFSPQAGSPPPRPDAFLIEPGEAEPRPGSVRRFGDYELLEEIARGGMGAVFRARQVSLKRFVAVKVLLAAEFANETSRERFRREAEAVASLNHPNIVSIYEVGEHKGRPYFSMELIEGRSLAELTRETPVPARRAAQWLKTIAEAVHYAHQRGVLHRDLKPSNVLVDKADVPHVTDFGLAKRIEKGEALTQTGQVLGTPSYMPPEQADPQRGEATATSDVYSLGAVLYHALTARPPFIAETLTQTLRLVAEAEPVSLRLLNPGVPSDLETICRKCLNKERERRYANAAELANELGRWLAGEPILARPATTAGKLWRWCRRNPALSATGAVAILVGVIGLTGVVWELRAARRAQANEERMRIQAQADEQAARKKAYASDMGRLQQALAADDFDRARELLARQRPKPGQADLRGWEWRYFWQFCQGDTRFTLCQRSSMIVSVSFSGDGALLAVGTRSGEVTVWDVGARRMIFKKEPASEDSGKLAFASSGPLLAFYDGLKGQRSVVLWDSGTRAEVKRLGLKDVLGELAFTRDGRLFTADFSESNNITVWDTSSGTALSQSTARLLNIWPSLRWTPFDIASDGSRFAYTTGDGPGSVRIAEERDSTDFSLRVAEDIAVALAFSRDGQILITSSPMNSAISLWEVRTRRLTGSLSGGSGYTTRLRVLTDGKTLVSCGSDRTIRLWDLDTRQPIQTLRGVGKEPSALDVSPDGQRLASGCTDGSVDLWDLTASTNRPPVYRTLQPDGAERWSYSPDGRLVGAIHGNRLEFYDALTLHPVPQLGPAAIKRYRFAFSPDMRLLVTTDTDGNLAAYDLPSRRPVTNFAAGLVRHYEAVFAFTAGGASLLALCKEGVVKEWDSTTWKEIGRWQADPKTAASAFCPASDLFATVTENGAFELIKAHQPEKRRRFAGPRVNEVVDPRLSLSTDGKTLAVVDGSGMVELWNTETLARKAVLRATQLKCFSVTTSPDGHRLAASGAGQEAIKIWDIDSLEELAAFPMGAGFDDVRFSPDGNTIGARSGIGVIHFWRAPGWGEIEAAERARPGHE